MQPSGVLADVESADCQLSFLASRSFEVCFHVRDINFHQQKSLCMSVSSRDEEESIAYMVILCRRDHLSHVLMLRFLRMRKLMPMISLS